MPYIWNDRHIILNHLFFIDISELQSAALKLKQFFTKNLENSDDQLMEMELDSFFMCLKMNIAYNKLVRFSEDRVHVLLTRGTVSNHIFQLKNDFCVWRSAYREAPENTEVMDQMEWSMRRTINILVEILKNAVVRDSIFDQQYMELQFELIWEHAAVENSYMRPKYIIYMIFIFLSAIVVNFYVHLCFVQFLKT